MTKGVDIIFEKAIDREDTLDTLYSSEYGDMIDLVDEIVHTESGSIFDNEPEEVYE